jgi:hypothetical protein
MPSSRIACQNCNRDVYRKGRAHPEVHMESQGPLGSPHNLTPKETLEVPHFPISKETARYSCQDSTVPGTLINKTEQKAQI